MGSSPLTAVHQHIDVVIQGLMIERRGRAHSIDVGWLDPSPRNPQAEGVETKLPVTGEILAIAVRKVAPSPVGATSFFALRLPSSSEVGRSRQNPPRTDRQKSLHPRDSLIGHRV